MMPTPFLVGQGPRPSNAQPLPLDEGAEITDWHMQQQAGNQATRMALQQMIRAQARGDWQANTQGLTNLASKGLGTAVAAKYPGLVKGVAQSVLNPILEPTRAAVGAVKDATGKYVVDPLVSAGKAVYNWGTTLSSGAATTAGATPATEAVAPIESGLGLGNVLGLATLGYGAYQGIKSGQRAGANVQEYVRQEETTPAQDDAARQQAYNSGMVKMGIGGGAGLLSGGILGALAGGAGGATQQIESTKGEEGSDLAAGAKRRWEFMKNPLRRG